MLESLFNKIARPSGLLQDLSLTRTLKILFFVRQNLKKCHQPSINYVLKHVKFKVVFTEPYLEQSRISAMEFFCKTVNGCKLFTIISKKHPCRYTSGRLDRLCEMATLNSFILQYLYHNQFVFCFRKWKYYIEKHLIGNFTRLKLIYKHHLRNTNF